MGRREGHKVGCPPLPARRSGDDNTLRPAAASTPLGSRGDADAYRLTRGTLGVRGLDRRTGSRRTSAGAPPRCTTGVDRTHHRARGDVGLTAGSCLRVRVHFVRGNRACAVAHTGSAYGLPVSPDRVPRSGQTAAINSAGTRDLPGSVHAAVVLTAAVPNVPQTPADGGALKPAVGAIVTGAARNGGGVVVGPIPVLPSEQVKSSGLHSSDVDLIRA